MHEEPERSEWQADFPGRTRCGKEKVHGEEFLHDAGLARGERSCRAAE